MRVISIREPYATLIKDGIERKYIIIDPGIGISFGKTDS